MTIPTTTASPWPARCAYISAAIFTAASGLTNLTYGWQKGDTLATSLVWSGVAGAVAIVFALSWPALIRSVDARRWSAALISLVALALSGAYSVTAALGSASGGRVNAAAIETATTDARTKAQAAYDAAKAELDALTAAKPATELQAPHRGRQGRAGEAAGGALGCRSRGLAHEPPSASRSATVAHSSTAQWRMSCPKLDAETCPRAAARAPHDQDRRLERQRSSAPTSAAPSSALGRRPRWTRRPPSWRSYRRPRWRTATPRRLRDTSRRSALDVTPERLNDLLVLLAVLMIEAGGGLSLAIGMALSGPVRAP